jgi:hypothetical protein
MIRHIWSVLCSQSVIDAQSNNVSLFNVIEQLTVVMKKTIIPEGKIPLLPISLELVTLWERGELEQGGSQGHVAVDVLDPTGKRLGGQDINVDVSVARRCRSKLAFGGIPVTTSGRYIMRVSIREDADDQPRVVAEVPLEVSVAYESDTLSPGELSSIAPSDR